MRKPNFLSGSDLDRAALRRRDETWLRNRLRDSAARVLPVWRSRHPVVMGRRIRPVALEARHLERWIADDHGPWVFLGNRSGVAYFAADLSQVSSLHETVDLPAASELRDLRAIGALLDRQDGALLAYARSILSWHRRHRFCGQCGTPTRVGDAGHVRRCPSEGCGAVHFPRTDPAVIMLVTRGDQALLGRQASWPPGVYSTLAGFVEPGESLEEAVAREVFEETGVEVGAVHYHSSQPWPFPGSLMLGFRAEGTSEALRIDGEELEDARWLSREEILEGERRGTLRLPSEISIARRLVEDWLRRDGGEPGAS